MSFSEALTRELNDELQHKVAAGDEDARTQMIEGNMRLAASKVEQFVAQRPQFAYMKDDLLSDAFVGLTEAVDAIRDSGVRDSTTGWLASCIQNRLLLAARLECKESGTVPQSPSDLAYDDGRLAAAEARESVYACCEDDLDREIVRQRELGHTDTEIAESLGCGRLSVARVRHRLSENFGNAKKTLKTKRG